MSWAEVKVVKDEIDNKYIVNANYTESTINIGNSYLNNSSKRQSNMCPFIYGKDVDISTSSDLDIWDKMIVPYRYNSGGNQDEFTRYSINGHTYAFPCVSNSDSFVTPVVTSYSPTVSWEDSTNFYRFTYGWSAEYQYDSSSGSLLTINKSTMVASATSTRSDSYRAEVLYQAIYTKGSNDDIVFWYMGTSQTGSDYKSLWVYDSNYNNYRSVTSPSPLYNNTEFSGNIADNKNVNSSNKYIMCNINNKLSFAKVNTSTGKLQVKSYWGSGYTSSDTYNYSIDGQNVIQYIKQVFKFKNKDYIIYYNNKIYEMDHENKKLILVSNNTFSTSNIHVVAYTNGNTLYLVQGFVSNYFNIFITNDLINWKTLNTGSIICYMTLYGHNYYLPKDTYIKSQHFSTYSFVTGTNIEQISSRVYKTTADTIVNIYTNSNTHIPYYIGGGE